MEEQVMSASQELPLPACSLLHHRAGHGAPRDAALPGGDGCGPHIWRGLRLKLVNTRVLICGNNIERIEEVPVNEEVSTG